MPSVAVSREKQTHPTNDEKAAVPSLVTCTHKTRCEGCFLLHGENLIEVHYITGSELIEGCFLLRGENLVEVHYIEDSEPIRIVNPLSVAREEKCLLE